MTPVLWNGESTVVVMRGDCTELAGSGVTVLFVLLINVNNTHTYMQTCSYVATVSGKSIKSQIELSKKQTVTKWYIMVVNAPYVIQKSEARCHDD